MDIVKPTIKSRGRLYTFSVELKGLASGKASLSASEVEQTIQVSPPDVFGGDGKDWSPEHLFLSSICSCFVFTYLLFAKKYEFEAERIECNTSGQVEFIDGRYQFTRIDIYPRIYLDNEKWKDKALIVLEKTPLYCIVANSISAEKIYHGQVITEPAVEARA